MGIWIEDDFRGLLSLIAIAMTRGNEGSSCDSLSRALDIEKERERGKVASYMYSMDDDTAPTSPSEISIYLQ
jgi:hypothetical protein